MGPGEGPVLPIQMKQAIRTEMIHRRLALAEAERLRLSEGAQRALIGSEAYQRARLILLYQPFRGETETALIAREAVAAGKGLALPRVQKEPRQLWLHAYRGEPKDLISGAYGILEPDPAGPLVDPARIDLVVVPGVAFDRQGNRLGYGGGFYDRTLPVIRRANPAARLIGLAYGFQVVAQLPPDPHDIPVDGLATEDGLIAATRG